MGASFETVVIEAQTVDEARLKWNGEVEQDLHENGHSYSGTIGMLGEGFELRSDVGIFASVEHANRYIENEQEKWDGAIGVRAKLKSGKLVFVVGGWCSS